MRNPWRAVRSLPKTRQIGILIANVIDRFLEEQPLAKANLLGGEGVGWDERQNGRPVHLLEVRRRLGKLLGAKSVEPAHPSPWVPDLIERYVEISGDPETDLATWVRDGAPTGVARPITPGKDIFPKTDKNFEQLEIAKLYNRQDVHQN